MTEPADEVRAITREAAASKNISYSTPVIIHETSRRRVVLVPFYIQHTDHTELAAKLVTYKKSPPPNEWALWQEKSVSLNESATRELHRALRDHLNIAKENADGSFLVIRVSEGTANIGEHDPAAVAGALTKVLSQHEIVAHLADTELSESLITAFRGAIRLGEMRRAVQELRVHLSNDVADESVYQSWCQKHSWAFGNAYVMTDRVREISPGDHRPAAAHGDFGLPRHCGTEAARRSGSSV